jgi:hypothetical protein
MSTFKTPQTITLPSEAIERANKFADAVIETVNYADSTQFSKTKIRDDHFVSKLGEEAVRMVFVDRFCTVDGPDYEIYIGRRKSWRADLIINGLDVAVKTQRRSAAGRYGLSWTFQDSPERRDPILNQPEAWVALVELDDLGGKFDAVVYPLYKIKQLIFEEPRIARLVGKKRAVYYETMFGRK